MTLETCGQTQALITGDCIGRGGVEELEMRLDVEEQGGEWRGASVEGPRMSNSGGGGASKCGAHLCPWSLSLVRTARKARDRMHR